MRSHLSISEKWLHISLCLCISQHFCKAWASQMPFTRIKKPPSTIYFDTLAPVRPSFPPMTGFTFPSTRLKYNLRPTSTYTSITTPFPMSPSDAMMVAISGLTHAAFAYSTVSPRFQRLQKATARPYDGATSGSQSKLVISHGSQSKPDISHPSKIGGFIGHNFKTPPKPTPPPKLHLTEKVTNHSDFNLQVSESGANTFITANELSGNRPTAIPYHFPATKAPHTTQAPPTSPSTTLSPVNSPEVPQSSAPRSRTNQRHREGKKVKSPHNYNFAPTQNPIGLAQGELDLAKEDVSVFRAALNKFGSRRAPPPLSQTTTTKFEEAETEAPTTTSTSTASNPAAIRIEQGKIIAPQGVTFHAADEVKGQIESKGQPEVKGQPEELPFYKESGGIFEPHGERETRLYPGHAQNSRRPESDFLPAVTYRPLTFDPGQRSRQERERGGARPRQNFQNAPPKTTVEFHHYDAPSFEDRRPAAQTPATTTLFQGGFDDDTYGLLPFTSTTTDRNIHFEKKPPPRFDPASDYFYGDPRPPPPTKPTQAPPADAPPPEEEAEDEEEEEEEEEDPQDSKNEDKGEREEDEEGEEEEQEDPPEHRRELPKPEPPRSANRFEPQNENRFEPPSRNRFHPSNEENFEPPSRNRFEPQNENRFEPPGRNRFQQSNENRFEPPNENRFEQQNGNRYEPQSKSRFEPPNHNRLEPSNHNRFEPPNHNRFEPPSHNRFTPTRGQDEYRQNHQPQRPTQRPFRPSHPDPFQSNRHQNYDNRNSFVQNRPFTPRAPPAPPSGSLDPIYRMSIRDYDQEVKRRQNKNQSSNAPFRKDAFSNRDRNSDRNSDSNSDRSVNNQPQKRPPFEQRFEHDEHGDNFPENDKDAFNFDKEFENF